MDFRQMLVDLGHHADRGTSRYRTGARNMAFACGYKNVKIHWKEHKSMFNSLKGGSWRSLAFSFRHYASTLATTQGFPLHFFSMDLHNSICLILLEARIRAIRSG
ncbi:ankyrin repeat and mynd domain-containing protein 2-like [Moniliophthora roreri]|nr:ankyrin repeat and mynd domain-containing protein 2-like [Moniliophthora roreri]